MRWIACLLLLHLYATAEARRRQLHPGACLAVVRQHQVVDATAPAARVGVKPGLTLRQARLICPSLQVVPFTPEHYVLAARPIWDLCAALSPTVEPVYPHLVFLDLGASSQPPATASRLLADVRQQGYTAALGVGPNKLVARLAAEEAALRPPHQALLHIPSEAVSRFLAPIPLDRLWPVPPDIRERLLQLGLQTCGELARWPRRQLGQLFGPLAADLLTWARGEDPSPVVPRYPAPAISVRWNAAMTEEGGGDGLTDRQGLQHVLDHLAQELAAHLRQQGMATAHLTLSIEAHRPCPPVGLAPKRPLSTAAELKQATLQLLQRVAMCAPITAVTLQGQALVPAMPHQETLFPGRPSWASGVAGAPMPPEAPARFDPEDGTRATMAAEQVLRFVRDRFGSRSLRRASQLPVSRRERVRALWGL